MCAHAGNGVSLLTVLFEDVPMVCLNSALVFGEDVADHWVIGSSFVSLILIGHKFSSVLGIKRAIDRRATEPHGYMYTPMCVRARVRVFVLCVRACVQASVCLCVCVSV
jgi:hypothetical protein